MRGWHHKLGSPEFEAPDEPSYAGISGGRTSAMMSALLAPNVKRYFSNTGREHDETLKFLRRLPDLFGHEITWLEFRSPTVIGDRPRNFRYEVVNFETANRTGKPFEEFMTAINAYRASLGKDIVTPWARQRLCTAYLKHKVADHWIADNGVKAHTRFIGLRADEPERVRRLKTEEGSSVRTFRCPLADAGIEASDVEHFWRGRPEDLRLEPFQGNCEACFLKDEADLARVLQEPGSDANWWIAIQGKYPGFGGFKKVPYRVLRDEGPYRVAVESAIRDGLDPRGVPSPLEKRRTVLVIRQEMRRIREGAKAVSCSCEAGMTIGDDGDGFE